MGYSTPHHRIKIQNPYRSNGRNLELWEILFLLKASLICFIYLNKNITMMEKADEIEAQLYSFVIFFFKKDL